MENKKDRNKEIKKGERRKKKKEKRTARERKEKKGRTCIIYSCVVLVRIDKVQAPQ
jgi:hypothetical protein